MSSKAMLLKLVQSYLRSHPSPAQITLISGLLKLGYSYSSPFTNSKSNKQLYIPIRTINKGEKVNTLNYPQNVSLSFDEKNNILKESNSFDGIVTEQFHQKILQDDVFGKASKNINLTRWVYVAKQKVKKTKSYFLGGTGKEEYVPDFGETYEGINNVGIYIWDVTEKKIIEIEIKIQGNNEKYILANPIFANDQGSKIICHGYRRTQFGHGLLHCFNRPVSIFEITITKKQSDEQIKQGEGKKDDKKDDKKEDKWQFSTKILINKERTNIFANISRCRNYILYFGGEEMTHTHYLDLIILKRNVQLNKQNNKQSEQWEEIHRKKSAFIGYYDTAKSIAFQHEGEQYAYYQTIDKAKSIIRKINLRTGQESDVAGGQSGESYSLSKVIHKQELLLGYLLTHKGSGFFSMPFGEKPQPLITNPVENILLEQYYKPIHAYYLEGKEDFLEESIKRQKKPLIVLVHGGPHGASQPTLSLLRYVFLKLGYAILLPNFSGSTGFGTEYLNNALGSIGKTDANEIIDMLEDVLQKKPYLDRQKVHVYGGSYGGYMTGILGSRYHKHFKSGIILNGALALPGMFWFTDIPQWITTETCQTEQYHKDLQKIHKNAFDQSPISEPMKIPILQFLGAKDLRVPHKQGILFGAISNKHGTPFKTHIYENSGHSLSDSVETTIDVIMKSVMFFEGIDEQ